MPKKRSVKTWRKSETGEEFRTTVEESIHQEALEKESNENLFFIDTGGMCAGWIWSSDVNHRQRKNKEETD